MLMKNTIRILFLVLSISSFSQVVKEKMKSEES